jgi:hypothetical protein
VVLSLDDLSRRPPSLELKRALLRLSLMSHAGTVNYDASTSGASSEDTSPGGGRPSGAPDRPTRKDRVDFIENFRQKPAEWFVSEFNHVAERYVAGRLSIIEFDDKVVGLARAAVQAIRDWTRTPPAEQAQVQWQSAPGAPDTPTLEWRIRIGNERGSSRHIATKYSLSHTTVLRYRNQYGGLAP